jgi:hypothetical protein
LPATVAIDGLVHRTDKIAVCIESLKAYPNGFIINAAILLDPRTAHERRGMMHIGGEPSRMPRLGVRFSDGRSGGQSGPFGNRGVITKDEQGVPTDVWMQRTGGGGGGNSWRFGAWVFPLPPAGPMEVFVGVPAEGLDEASVTVEGASVREAARRAVVLWE